MSDYIKREDAIDALSEAQRTTSNDEFGSSVETEWETAGLALAKAVVNEVPSADVVESKHGKWLLDGRCSECFEYSLSSHKNFCPNCGADMRGSDNE